MILNDISRPALLLASLLLTAACSKAAPGQDPAHDVEYARRNAEAVQRAVAALPSACTLGTAAKASQGSWLNAPKSMPEPGHPTTFLQLFDAATMTGAVRAALDRAALAALDKAEFRDADGKWADAGARQIDALRYTFRSSAAPITLANAALFKSN